MTMIALYNSRGKEGRSYAKKVFRLYEKSKKPISGFVSFILLFLLSTNLHASADPPIDRNTLTLSDGRWIWLKDFEDDNERTWAYAYFVYLEPEKLLVDINGDGIPEVGIATYDLGTNVRRSILIFSVHAKSIVPLREHGPIDLAADRSLFK